MHELSVCQDIVLQVERIAREHCARVSAITVKVGPLSGVEGSLLERAYPLAAAGSSSSNARLVIDAMPVRVRCRACRRETETAANRLVCGHCGEWQTDLVSGDELLLTSVELEPDPSTLH
ncbi:MAG: hydrogenase maturation nickel metallochaperone HypA [Steroidobacteraceae bacterium]